jgi:O-antigen/teichoic acid export membrane protein
MRQGYSFVSLAVLEAVAAVIANALTLHWCLRLYPQLQLSFLAPSQQTLRGMGTYSGQLVLWQICGRIIAASPTLVIGAMLSPAAVTFYALGAYLPDAAQQIRMAVTPTFMPLATRYEAVNDLQALRTLLHRGTRLALVVVLPVLVGLITRGETFLEVWLGHGVSGPAGEVLRVLSLGMILITAVATASVIVLGVGRQREALFWSGLHAIATPVLSFVLGRTFGLVGVAWAVVASSLFTVAQSLIVCRLVGVSLMAYVRTSWATPMLASLPFAFSCVLIDRYWQVNSIQGFLAQMALACPIYALSCMLFMADDLRQGWSMLRGSKERNVGTV